MSCFGFKVQLTFVDITWYHLLHKITVTAWPSSVNGSVALPQPHDGGTPNSRDNCCVTGWPPRLVMIATARFADGFPVWVSHVRHKDVTWFCTYPFHGLNWPRVQYLRRYVDQLNDLHRWHHLFFKDVTLHDVWLSRLLRSLDALAQWIICCYHHLLPIRYPSVMTIMFFDD